MSAERASYLDSSAIVKLVVREPESRALRMHLRTRPIRASCGLALVEVLRAVRAHGPAAVARARAILSAIHVVHLDEALLNAAAELDGSILRSLDAIHLAAAQAFGSDLGAVVTYDARMSEAAQALGLPVIAPA
jgi:uncharacterized protein